MGWYDAVAGKGLRWLALDHRGHGESARPHEAAQYARDAMAGDVFALMDHAGVERAHLLGFSMGSHVALTAALLDGGRIDHLVVGGVGAKIFEPARDPDAMAQAMEAPTPDAIADPMAKRLEGLRQFLDFNLPKGITYLVHAAQTLEAYAEVHTPQDATSTAPSAESETPSA